MPNFGPKNGLIALRNRKKIPYIYFVLIKSKNVFQDFMKKLIFSEFGRFSIKIVSHTVQNYKKNSKIKKLFNYTKKNIIFGLINPEKFFKLHEKFEILRIRPIFDQNFVL